MLFVLSEVQGTAAQMDSWLCIGWLHLDLWTTMRAGVQRPGHAPACCRVFITHMHGDHVFGLPGLLRAISRRCQELAVAQPDTVRIYGPPGVL